ncbi:MAG: hypothetical protein M1834_006559 [Cirrosporium novae-zelandiae]|nr:MAG: hypothetical protein M1834_006559 [Cirrosporium novae-zelandiae]
MQSRRFENAQYVRRLIDTIKDTAEEIGQDRGMVLERFPHTLWEVRKSGRLASIGIPGIRSIMKDALKGIEEIHTEGLIHLAFGMKRLNSGIRDELEIKSQNILLDGITAKLSDLGSDTIATPPSTGTVQPMPYRSPEALFDLQWSEKTDIWGWGMVYLHMVQAYLRSDIWGLYDMLPEETTVEKTEDYEKRIQSEIFHDFRLDSVTHYQKCKELWPKKNPEREGIIFQSILEYLGFARDDIGILEKVLIPDPKQGPTAGDILRKGWLDIGET